MITKVNYNVYLRIYIGTCTQFECMGNTWVQYRLGSMVKVTVHGFSTMEGDVHRLRQLSHKAWLTRLYMIYLLCALAPSILTGLNYQNMIQG